MELQPDPIVPIPPNRVKFFGTTGKMLLPTPATIAALIQQIPAHKLVTSEILRKYLASQFEVEGVCPVTTQKSLQTVYKTLPIAHWRVVGKHGELLSRFPGGLEAHAAHLKQEGFVIDTSAKVPKVQGFKDFLTTFAQ